MIQLRPRESLYHVDGGWFSAYWHFSFDDYDVPESSPRQENRRVEE